MHLWSRWHLGRVCSLLRADPVAGPSNALPFTYGSAARAGRSMILRCFDGGTAEVQRLVGGTFAVPFGLVPETW